MIKIKKVEVYPSKEKFGIVHKLVVGGENLNQLKESFNKFSSAKSFEADNNTINLVFNDQNRFQFELEKPLEDYYTDEVHQAWKAMVADALGMEEPFRYYSFFTEEGEHLGTVGFKQDCDSFYPIIVIYKKF